MPADAEIFTRKGDRFARWTDAKKKSKTAPVTIGKKGQDRIVVTARTYTAKYRDGSGVVREVPTGCRDETAARAVLTELEKRADKVRSGLRTAAEDAAVDHQSTPLVEHVAGFLAHQRAKGLSRRVDDTKAQLERVARDCCLGRLSDLEARKLERWLVEQKAAGMSAATRNEYRGAWTTFCNWCVRDGRLLINPFAHVPRADVKTDRRRQRRSLTEDELVRLLDVARRRPLLDRMTIRRGKRKGQACANLREATRRRLELLGRERAMIYKMLVLTGLRKGELASLTAGQLDLDADPPYLTLDAADEKNREGNAIVLRADLAADLRGWLAEKAASLQETAREAPVVPFDPNHQPPGQPGSPDAARPWGTLPADTPVFRVPAGLIRILDRDLRLAGIPKRDERGRTVDVHAMRTTFGTLLSKAGVRPRTAQAAMRHSTINLTMNTYTDPKLLDVAGAVESLPDLPLTAGTEENTSAVRATGTEGSMPSQFAPKFAPTADKTGPTESNSGKTSPDDEQSRVNDPSVVSACPVKRKDPLTSPDSGSSEWAMTDSNRRHPRCKRGALTN